MSPGHPDVRDGLEDRREALLDGLNPAQREAVLHNHGPLLLLSGAGSGKTRVVTHRIARLIHDGVPPGAILALTFTNRAAREMRDRVSGLLRDTPHAAGAASLTISTYHALGARLLRRYASYFARTPRFSIYDDADQLTVIRQVLADAGHADRGSLVRAIRRCFDLARCAGLAPSDAASPDEGPLLDMRALGTAYERALERADAFDFGDLITGPLRLLTERPDVAETLRARWPHVMVDEFQDTNPAQYAWLRQLAPPPDAQLVVVGDDDQSVYGWRGAKVEIILGFAEHYPGARVLKLEQNYRSVGHVLTAANGVIAHNRRRLGKTLWTAAPEGARIEVHEAMDEAAEAEWVARRIASLCAEEGVAAGEVAVLMRTAQLSQELEQALLRRRVGYAVVRGRAFYDRAEVRDLLAWMRVVVNPHDEVALRRAIAAPRRGVGKATLDRLAATGAATARSLWDAAHAALSAGEVRGRAASGLRGFVTAIQTTQEIEAASGAAEAARRLLELSGLEGELVSAQSGDETERGRRENIERLIDAAARHHEAEPAAGLAGFLESVALVSEVDAPAGGAADAPGEAPRGAVSLMTIHAAKGLEFPVVFVLGLDEGVFPHQRALREDAEEEERRLCYVALTRAEQRLFLTRASRRRMYGEWVDTRASRFLREIPPSCIEPTWNADATGARAPRSARGPEYGPVRRFGGAARDPRAPRMGRGASPQGEGADGWGDGRPRYRRDMRVLHAQYGVGRVLTVTAGTRPTLSVEFPDVGTLTVIADFVSPYEG